MNWKFFLVTENLQIAHVFIHKQRGECCLETQMRLLGGEMLDGIDDVNVEVVPNQITHVSKITQKFDAIIGNRKLVPSTMDPFD